jgi:hypothetical protein
MKTITISMLCLLWFAGCASTGERAVTGAGSGDGDALLSVGKVVDGKAEVGITGVGFEGPVKTDYAVGPYAVYLIPTTEDIAQDWQPFAGGAMLFDENLDAIPKLVAGVIYQPHSKLCPVYFAEKAFPSGSVNSVNIAGRSDDIYHWFGLRYRW